MESQHYLFIINNSSVVILLITVPVFELCLQVKLLLNILQVHVFAIPETHGQIGSVPRGDYFGVKRIGMTVGNPRKLP